jgi:hypothetical protein
MVVILELDMKLRGDGEVIDWYVGACHWNNYLVVSTTTFTQILSDFASVRKQDTFVVQVWELGQNVIHYFGHNLIVDGVV